MKRPYVIAMDTHCQETECVVLSSTDRLVRRQRCPTTIPELVTLVNSVRRPREVVFEEGPLADWLLRNLGPYADRITACDPRRNHLIAKGGDKDDTIDAEKLATLYRGGYVKPVYHAQSLERVVFKRHVALYHDRVRQRVRQANRIMAELRHYGVFVRETDFAEATLALFKALLAQLPAHPLIRRDLACLLSGYAQIAKQVAFAKRQLIRWAQKEPQIVRFAALPGVKWIRASTFFAYVDTPWRFRSKSALWKYLGLGLERRQSGQGAERVHLCTQVNRVLKGTMLGAAKSAIRGGDNPFAEQSVRWFDEGLTSRIVRRNVARSQAAVMWGMWKSGSVYRPEWVGRAAPDLISTGSATER